ncbi:response regulator transcription factor [Listeria ivanovii]|uniref:Heme response regulator HssR n=1 Tax=Listeria ivanovii (strain ATCC BAA-678 / PAM 55) TaxID=881621 RepID=G2ZDB7_LISIP|nr:response regulator transcription factor [Listeria ivanovii]AHI55314.1 heme response regulator HssR [Listeria ivanovii WSLC3009]AIS64773.1 heme response regulator HssR [Listeria ivanovii subsp. ivanovii]MBC1758523.1 response regulator transcription factor [Listeria ivanovii]MBK3913398.1 response regulator transcription factor [Listeria ivanovii subsp. ivanovii]MBK3920484.1 response regulator transcription factor [Listeria ivanovii subsp. ivanovii]
MKQILIVDDDKHIRKLVGHYLRREGFHVLEASDGEDAEQIVSSKQVHLAVIDVMMPKMDGFELCQKMRTSYPEIPIIMLTAKDALIDKSRGFEVGTDDYLTKPFEPEELVFRIRALLRRSNQASEVKIHIGNITIDQKSYGIKFGQREQMIPVKEFELLYQLASYPSRIFTREELIERIWQRDYDGSDRTVDVHIKRLRDHFDEGKDGIRIVTVRGVGYKLEETI